MGLVLGLALGGTLSSDDGGAPVPSPSAESSPSAEPPSSGRVARRAPVTSDDSPPAPTTEPADGTEGSREDPYPLGETVTSEEWEITRVPIGTDGVWALATLFGDRVFFAAG